MGKNNKTVVFFPLYYPYSFPDSYVDEEINLLSEKVDKIIVVTADIVSTDMRPAPADLKIFRFSSHAKGQSRYVWFKALFSSVFYSEIFKIIFKYRITFSFGLLTELLAFYGRGIRTRDFIKQLIADEKLDISKSLIYTYWMLEPTFAATLIKNDIPGLKIISRVHSQDVYFFRNPYNYMPYRKYVFDRLEHLYFISENAQKYFIEKHSLTDAEIRKTSVARIGVPGKGVFIKSTATSKLKILSVAFVQKLKRVDLVIDALALLDDVEVDWCHAGHSTQSEGYFEQVKNYAAKKLSGKPNIKFVFTGKTLGAELNKIYEEGRFDVFINTSVTEGIPVSMMEAMSYSVPVMGTNVGGVSEIIEHEKNGFLLKPDINPIEIAALLRVYSRLQDTEKDVYRQNAFNTWNEKFNALKNYSAFTDEISRL